MTRELEKVRLTKGGKKTYHTMIAAYFLDLAKIWQNSRKVMAKDSRICFVIGDSAPYGVHVAAERWLGELAKGALRVQISAHPIVPVFEELFVRGTG